MALIQHALWTVALAFAWSQAAASSTALYMQSQPGDYVGQGQTYEYKAPTDTFQVTASLTGITVSIDFGGPSWELVFTPPTGTNFADGVYEGAQRAEFKAPGVPGIDVTGEGRGCNSDTGRFEIFNLKQDSHGTVISFILQFEQHCEGATPALFGQLQYNATGGLKSHVSVASARALKGNARVSDGTVALSLSRPLSHIARVSYATADGTAIAGQDYLARHGAVLFPAGTTTQYLNIPVLGNRSVTGNRDFSVMLSQPVGVVLGATAGQVDIVDPNGPLTVLAMTSQPGDYIGGGVAWLESSDYTSFSGALNGNVAAVNLGEPEFWTLDFAAPSGEALNVGTYLNAQRYPFQPNGVPGLSVYGDGRGCNTLTGAFTVNSIAPNLSTFSADFQQNCEGGSAALFGSIRLNALLQQMSVTNASVKDGNAEFLVTVNPVSNVPVAGFFQTFDGTAKAGVNYKAVSTSVTIPAGHGAALVKVPLIGMPEHGLTFYGMLTAADLPPVWIPIGAARL